MYYLHTIIHQKNIDYLLPLYQIHNIHTYFEIFSLILQKHYDNLTICIEKLSTNCSFYLFISLFYIISNVFRLSCGECWSWEPLQGRAGPYGWNEMFRYTVIYQSIIYIYLSIYPSICLSICLSFLWVCLFFPLHSHVSTTP